MVSLNFKKVGSSLLILAIVAGCTSNTPVKTQAPVPATATLKAAEVKTIDLGTKDGGNVRVNFRFADKQQFRLKAPPPGTPNDFPINTNIVPVPGSLLKIRLYRTTGAVPPAMVRFDAAMVAPGSALTGNVVEYTLPNPPASSVVKFVGLKDGFDYYISARIYGPWYDISTSNITVSINPSGNGISLSSKDLSGLMLWPTDQVNIAGTVTDVVTSPAPAGFDSFTVAQPVPGGPTSGLAFGSFSRNIVGVGTIGGAGGMAADGAQAGGGTAPGYTTGAGEEFVHFNGTGLNIVNDDSITSPGTPNDTLDMEINLMRSLGATVDGNIIVNPGDLAPDEAIVP
jgi:hypothetical protein